MSDKSVTLESLGRNQRSFMRQIRATRLVIENAFLENPSEDVAFKISAHLDEWRNYLIKLEEVVDDIIELTDFTGKSPDEVAQAEAAISKQFEQSSTDFATAKGKVNAMFARLKKPSELTQSRKSLDSSFTAEGSVGHALVKLPDIPVPKFDGKMKNFTEWHSLFSAMIDKNESLKPVQKLYFLKQAMVGDASALLKDHTLQEGAYDSAFKYVEQRYYNRRALIATHFHDLLELPSVTLPTLRETLDKVNAIIRGLKVCKLVVEKMSPLIAFIVVRKLPDRIRTDWENSYADYSSYPSFEPLATFLQNRCFAYESVHPEPPKPVETKKAAATEERKKPKATLAMVSKQKPPSQNASSPKCILCEKAHYLSQCGTFLEKSIADRFAFVREKRLCANCFRQYHAANVCNSSKCRKCGDNHNTLLHREISNTSIPEKRVDPPSDTEKAEPKKTGLCSALLRFPCNQEIVMLPSAVILVLVGTKFFKARALIDPCSQLELIGESFIRKYRLATKAAMASVLSVNPNLFSSSLSVQLKVKSRFSNFSLEYEANVVGRIPYQITANTIRKVASLDPTLQLAECELPYDSVDLLIGAKYANVILTGEKKFFDGFSLQSSTFGWITEGPLCVTPTLDTRCCHLTVKVEDDLAQFFEVEEVAAPTPAQSERERCEAHFMATYNRLENGKFQVRLPRDKPLRALANTYAQAKASLLKFEQKLDAETRSMYVDFMREYQELNHMRLAVNLDVPRYFIPHLFIMRPDSSSTRFRAVFNASARNQSGLSLNQALLVGPTLQPDLFDIILRFRMHAIAFAADISKMYRQIEVHPDDRPLQSILWRDEPNEPIHIYELTTVTYGTAPASYIATKCLQMIAEQLAPENSEAAKAIASEFYMDDLLTGASSLAKAVAKQKTIHLALAGAHFPLRKYISNSSQFLATLDPSLVEPLQPIEFAPTGAAKILGLQWEPATDCFSIKTAPVNLSGVTLTKRIVASVAAQAFDPTGFAAPVIIRAKILLQDLWREGKAWDDPVSEELAKTFINYQKDVSSLSAVSVPRFYHVYENSSITLAGFCDASPRAYGAAVYLRAQTGEQTHVTLVCAKSKVAPLKSLTIPRLELLGAVLLTKLLVRVSNTLKINLSHALAFSDSQVVLAWLNSSSEKFQVFVRNRVEFVNSVLPASHWHYVHTNENPADLLTRGITVNVLLDNKIWIRGPNWLSNQQISFCEVSKIENVPEVCVSCNLSVREPQFREEFLELFSDFGKLIRIAALIWKYVSRLSSNLTRFTNFTPHFCGIYVLCRVSQWYSFRFEISEIRKGNALPPKNALVALSPFLDSYGMLRVGGRLTNSKLSNDAKHPIILSRKSSLVALMARYYHERYYHADRSFVVAHIQSRFWITGGLSQLVKKIIHSCVYCIRMRGNAVAQIMGNLPSERVTISRPFSCVGVDFAGPFSIRCVNHRSYKQLKYYAAFFVCFSTKCVHLEHVSDLSTIAFIAALQRFSARRGLPNTIWSDNATNFVGADRLLQRHCETLGITWKFIPARSPHHGGLWEAAVKAGKKLFFAAAQHTTFDLEQFVTVLTQVESILNSRPLYQRREVADPGLVDVLTPGHFLVGSHLLHVAPVETHAVSLSDRLKFQNQVARSFWNTWSKSYLAQLQSRSKWQHQSANLNVGDIVVLKDESPPLQWRMGRVVKVTPDAEGQVRLVEVFSSGSILSRAVQKLIKLPVEPVPQN